MENQVVEKNPTEGNNIFDELSSEVSDLQDLEEKRKKDVYFYLGVISKSLKVANIIFIIFFTVSFFYIYIQKSEKNLDISFLSPFCQVFIGSSSSQFSGCNGVTYLINDVQQQLSKLKENQYKKIQEVLPDLYAVDNFIYSRDVSFLLSKSESRVKPLQMMATFDKLKTSFDPIEKSKIQCGETAVDQEGFLNVDCVAFSSDWDTKIIGFNGEKVSANVEGTSISIANSFINYIEKSSKEFVIIDKQKVFSTDKVTEGGAYTKKTPFSLRLKYNNQNNF